MRPADLLLFGAHCDDGELFAGGTVAKMVGQGKSVALAVAHHDLVRRPEAQASAAVLGCTVYFREPDRDCFEWARACLEAVEPQVLVTHPPTDPHFEHAALGAIVGQVLTKAKHRRAFPQRWYWLDTYYSTANEGVPLLVDVSAEFERKRAALECHGSQGAAALVDMAQAMNALHGRRIRVEYAEAFYAFPLLGRWPTLRDLP